MAGLAAGWVRAMRSSASPSALPARRWVPSVNSPREWARTDRAGSGLLPSGNVIATWLDWVGATPIGLYAVVVDETGFALGREVRVSEDKLYPQYQNAVAASPRGAIFTAWESRLDRGRGIAARRLLAP